MKKFLLIIWLVIGLWHAYLYYIGESPNWVAIIALYANFLGVMSMSGGHRNEY